MSAAGWYYAEGDPPGTHRYWDGTTWVGDPVPVAAPGAPPAPPAQEQHARGSAASPGDRIIGRIIDIIVGFVILVVIVMLDLGGTTSANVLAQDDVVFEFNGRALDTIMINREFDDEPFGPNSTTTRGSRSAGPGRGIGRRRGGGSPASQ